MHLFRSQFMISFSPSGGSTNWLSFLMVLTGDKYQLLSASSLAKRVLDFGAPALRNHGTADPNEEGIPRSSVSSFFPLACRYDSLGLFLRLGYPMGWVLYLLVFFHLSVGDYYEDVWEKPCLAQLERIFLQKSGVDWGTRALFLQVLLEKISWLEVAHVWIKNRINQEVIALDLGAHFHAQMRLGVLRVLRSAEAARTSLTAMFSQTSRENSSGDVVSSASSPISGGGAPISSVPTVAKAGLDLIRVLPELRPCSVLRQQLQSPASGSPPDLCVRWTHRLCGAPYRLPLAGTQFHLILIGAALGEILIHSPLESSSHRPEGEAPVGAAGLTVAEEQRYLFELSFRIVVSGHPDHDACHIWEGAKYARVHLQAPPAHAASGSAKRSGPTVGCSILNPQSGPSGIKIRRNLPFGPFPAILAQCVLSATDLESASGGRSRESRDASLSQSSTAINNLQLQLDYIEIFTGPAVPAE